MGTPGLMSHVRAVTSAPVRVMIAAVTMRSVVVLMPVVSVSKPTMGLSSQVMAVSLPRRGDMRRR